MRKEKHLSVAYWLSLSYSKNCCKWIILVQLTVEDSHVFWGHSVGLLEVTHGRAYHIFFTETLMLLQAETQKYNFHKCYRVFTLNVTINMFN